MFWEQAMLGGLDTTKVDFTFVQRPRQAWVSSRAAALHVDPGRKRSNHPAALPSGTDDLLSQRGWQE